MPYQFPELSGLSVGEGTRLGVRGCAVYGLVGGFLVSLAMVHVLRMEAEGYWGPRFYQGLVVLASLLVFFLVLSWVMNNATVLVMFGAGVLPAIVFGLISFVPFLLAPTLPFALFLFRFPEVFLLFFLGALMLASPVQGFRPMFPDAVKGVMSSVALGTLILISPIIPEHGVQSLLMELTFQTGEDSFTRYLPVQTFFLGFPAFGLFYAVGLAQLYEDGEMDG